MDDDVLCAMRALEERVEELERRVSAQEGPSGGLSPFEEELEALFADDCYDPDTDDGECAGEILAGDDYHS